MRFSAVEIAIVVAATALLLALGRPVFHGLRESAQEKAVLNNLHRLGIASDNYFLETGVTSVNSAELVATKSTQFIKQIQTIANESYCPVIVKGEPMTASAIAGQRTITFSN